MKDKEKHKCPNCKKPAPVRNWTYLCDKCCDEVDHKANAEAWFKTVKIQEVEIANLKKELEAAKAVKEVPGHVSIKELLDKTANLVSKDYPDGQLTGTGLHYKLIEWLGSKEVPTGRTLGAEDLAYSLMKLALCNYDCGEVWTRIKPKLSDDGIHALAKLGEAMNMQFSKRNTPKDKPPETNKTEALEEIKSGLQGGKLDFMRTSEVENREPKKAFITEALGGVSLEEEK